MARYVYEAFDSDGKLKKGEIEAISRASALDALHRQGKYPLDIEEGRAGAAVPWWQREVFGSTQLPMADLALLTSELATLVKADLPLDESLRMVSLQPLMSAKSRSTASAVLEQVRSGASLSSALAEGGRFPEYYWRLVQAGEASGSLAPVLDDLAKLIERSIETRRQLTSAMIYPMTLLVAAFIALGVIMGVLLPTIVPLFKDAGAELPPTVKVMVGARDFVLNNWAACLAILGCLIATAVVAARDARTATARDRFLLRLPVIGALIRDRETSRFARSLSTLVHNGVPLLDAVRITAGVLRNRGFINAVVAAGDSLKEGRSLSAPLIESRLFTELAVRLVGVGEKTGQLDTMLMQIANIYEATLQRQLGRLMTLLTPVLTITIGLVVGGLILSVMNAILSVNDLAFK